MPFTPYHFGAHACIALPLRKRINILVFVLANVVIDIEPLSVMVFNLSYPLHGYAHTFLGAVIIGGIWGGIAYQFKKIFITLLKILKLPYEFTIKQYVFSGVFGSLLHVLFDAPLYTDIQPFYPIKANPLYGLISNPVMYKICFLLFIPAIILYSYTIIRNKNMKHKETI
ncbi:MAG: hydrolase [Candidatus Aureabacteria bacterium]|nr:hydrolase [Candidatus Auribacterota bacterium]